MPVVTERRRTTLSEWAIGIAFTLFAVLAALALLAPQSWRQAFDERGQPLRSLDDRWSEVGHKNVSLEEFLRRPRRGSRLVEFQGEGGGLRWLTTRDERDENLNPIICPDGRVFLLDWSRSEGPPGVREWDGVSWRSVTVPVLAQDPQHVISDLTCAPDGRILFLASHAIYDQAGNRLGPKEPGFVVTQEGFYRRSTEPDTFPLWFARQPEGPWFPIGGGRRIQALAETSGGVLAWGENVGRVKGTTATWRDWPNGFKPTSVVPLSASGYIAWNDRSLYVTRTFEETPTEHEMPTPGRLTGILEGIDEPDVLWFLQGSRARRFRLR